MTSALLSQAYFYKETFDPSDIVHRKQAFKFLKTNSWKGITEDNTCPFFCEWPYLDVPSMLKDRLIQFYSEQN